MFYKVDVADYLTERENVQGLRLAQPLLFAGGRYSLSVQASKYHYCIPRETLPYSEYSHFEVRTNLPRKYLPPEWFDICEDNVYSYVPKSDINKLIRKMNIKYGMIPAIKVPTKKHYV